MAETPNATPTAAPAATPAAPQSVPDTGSLLAAGEQQMQAAQPQIQSEMTAGQTALQKAQDISAQPLQSDKPVPHARLLAMVQGLADGLGSFGKSLATHGTEGGAQEVAQLRAGRQQQQIEARNSEIAQRNQQVQQQITVGDTNMRMAQMHAMMASMPMDIAMKHLEAEKGLQELKGAQQALTTNEAQFRAEHGGMSAEEFNSAIGGAAPAGAPAGTPAAPPNPFFMTKAQQTLTAGANTLGANDPYVKQLQDTVANPNASAADLWKAQSNVATQIATQTGAAKDRETMLAAQPPSADMVKNFTSTTLPSYTHIPPQERQGYATEAAQAQTVTQFNATMGKALASEQAMIVHEDMQAQARNIQATKFQEAGLTQNDKLLTGDKGYLSAHQQAQQTIDSIQAGMDGNALITNLVPTMEVLGVNHAAGISRISPEEAKRAGTSPEWATRWNAWASRASTGKLTPELAQEGKQLMNIVEKAAYSKYLSSAKSLATDHKIDYENMPAVLQNGSNTTLDKAITISNLTNLHSNGQVTIGWDGKQWVDANTAEPYGAK